MRLRFEVIPEGAADGPDSLADRLLRAFPAPAEVTLTVTSLPQHGVERTLRSAVSLAALGFRVVPHLPARRIEGPAALSELVERMIGAGIGEVFTVSGDAARDAPEGSSHYTSSLELIRDLADLDAGLSIGIAGYPEGHPHFSDEHLEQHLLERAPFVDTIVTQLCYSPVAVAEYAERLRSLGVGAALWLGLPGAVGRDRLEVLSDRLGVGPSKELLERADSQADRAAGGFDSVRFVREVESQPAFIAAAGGATLAGGHVYTFNEIERLPALAEAVTVKHA